MSEALKADVMKAAQTAKELNKQSNVNSQPQGKAFGQPMKSQFGLEKGKKFGNPMVLNEGGSILEDN